MTKNSKILSAMIAAVLVASGQFAIAQTTNTTVTNVGVVRRVTISTKGKATLQGVVSSITGNSTQTSTAATRQFTLSTWGGDWTIDMASSTKVRINTGASINQLKIQNGDRVLVTGTANSSTQSIIASSITDRSIQRRTLTGTISNTGGQNGLFTLSTSRGFTLIVQPPVNGVSPVVSGNGVTSVSGLADGMTVRATGDLNLSNSFFFVTRIVVTRSASGNPTPTTPSTTLNPNTSTNPASSSPTPTTPSTPNTPTSTTPTAGSNVSIANSAFNPSASSVSAGMTVTWTNNDTLSHTVTADNGSFDSGVLQPGAVFSHTFTQPGTVPYHCTIHPFMHGSVTVH